MSQTIFYYHQVRELLRVQDCNGARMLTLITEQFLADPKLQQNVTMTDKCRQLWNHLGSLWTCIALNPNSGVHEKILLKKKLQHWSDLEACPIENKACENSGKQTVFSRALSACDLDWNCGTLQKILKSDGQNLVWLGKHPIFVLRILYFRSRFNNIFWLDMLCYNQISLL